VRAAPAGGAVAGVGRYAVCVMACAVAVGKCVIACATAFFCVGNVSPHAPQPYEASLFDAARAAFGFFGVLPFFGAAFVFGAAAAFVFAGFFAVGSFLAFAGFSTLAFGSRFGFSVPSMLQNRQPCRT